jgi:hypothetical protein
MAGGKGVGSMGSRCDGNVTTRHMRYEPFDFPAVHITKISDYRIHEQEAMGYRPPYMSSNGRSRFRR